MYNQALSFGEETSCICSTLLHQKMTYRIGSTSTVSRAVLSRCPIFNLIGAQLAANYTFTSECTRKTFTRSETNEVRVMWTMRLDASCLCIDTNSANWYSAIKRNHRTIQASMMRCQPTGGNASPRKAAGLSTSKPIEIRL